MSAPAAAAPAPEKPKKPKAKKKKALSFKQRWQIVLFSLLEVFYSTKSDEPDEKKMARFAVGTAAIGAFLLLIGIMTTAVLHTVYREEDEVSLSEVLRRKALEGKKESIFYNVGHFQVEIKHLTEVGQVSGVNAPVLTGAAPLAEFDLTAECDGQAPCDYLKNNPDVIRSEVSAVLMPIEREEIMGRDGKDRLKKIIVQRLNALVPHGQVSNVHFESLKVD